MRARKHRFHVITCPFIIDELETILILLGKLSATKADVQAALQLMHEAVQIIERPDHTEAGTCSGSEDNSVLDGVAASGADYLVTGDTDLFALKTFETSLLCVPAILKCFFSTRDLRRTVND